MKDTSASREHRKRVERIVEVSMRALARMYHPDCLRFCYTIAKHAPDERVPSFRYAAITLLGLSAARDIGVPVSFPLEEIGADLATRAGEEADLGNKALALWAALRLRSAATETALTSLLNHDGLAANPFERFIRSTELAWAVYSLAKACLDIKSAATEPFEESDIIDFCRGSVADFKIPSLVEFRNELPKSSTGKLLRKML